MLAIARDRARALNMAMSLREASADALPFPGASFNTVLCTVSLCSIPDDKAAIAEMFRVPRPGGRLILLDHVASGRRLVLAVERLPEPLALRMNGDCLTRRPLQLVQAAGFSVTWSQPVQGRDHRAAHRSQAAKRVVVGSRAGRAARWP